MKALKAGDDRHLTPRRKTIKNRCGTNMLYASRAMIVRCQDRDLPALPRTRRNSLFLQNDGKETGRHLLARGNYSVIFAPVVKFCGVLAPADKLIGRPGHRRDNDGDVMARQALPRDVPCNIANAFYVRDRCAAKFHHKTGHRVANASLPASDFR